MYCNSCGSLINDGQSYCANCGAPVTPPVQQAPAAVPAAKVKVSKGFAIAGFIFGISAAALCFVIFVNIVSFFEGLVGVIFSIIGLARKNGKLKAMAIIGLILCVFAMFVSGLMWASMWSKDAYNLFDTLFGWVYNLY